MMNKKDDYNLYTIIFPIIMSVLSGFNRPINPTTIINIYSDKKVEIKNDK